MSVFFTIDNLKIGDGLLLVRSDEGARDKFTLSLNSNYLATQTINGLMSAVDKAKLDGLGTQTQLDGKYVKKTGDTMTGNLVFSVGKGVNGSLVGVYPSSVSATNLDSLLKANTTFSYTFYYFPNTFTLTPALIAKNVVLADNSNTMQTWNSGSGAGYQRAIIYPSSSNPLLKFYGDVWKEYLFREDLASPTRAGAMSAADKAKLDGLGTGGTASGTTAVKLDDIATIGTTAKTLTVEASKQYWQTIATTTGSVTLKLTLDGTPLAAGNTAEIVFRWPNSGAYVGTIEILLGAVTVWSFTINQGTPAAVVKIAKIGGEIVTSYIK